MEMSQQTDWPYYTLKVSQKVRALYTCGTVTKAFVVTLRSPRHNGLDTVRLTLIYCTKKWFRYMGAAYVELKSYCLLHTEGKRYFKKKKER